MNNTIPKRTNANPETLFIIKILSSMVLLFIRESKITLMLSVSIIQHKMVPNTKV